MKNIIYKKNIYSFKIDTNDFEINYSTPNTNQVDFIYYSKY